MCGVVGPLSLHVANELDVLGVAVVVVLVVGEVDLVLVDLVLEVCILFFHEMCFFLLLQKLLLEVPLVDVDESLLVALAVIGHLVW